MATAQQQLDGFLKKYSPEMEEFGRAAIAHLQKRLPGAICLAYDNYNALAVGFGPTAKASLLPLSIALYPRWAALFLMDGASLEDPDGLMQGKGARIRSLRLSGLAMLKSEPVDQLIAAAVLQAGWKLDPKAKGELLIKSISPKQRPRRPS
jgi:hypothetical protein